MNSETKIRKEEAGSSHPVTGGAAATAASSEPLMSVENLSITLGTEGGEAIAVLDRLNLIVGRNSTTALVGESGSGKTVTALAILGLLKARTVSIAKDSRIVFAGRNLLQLTERELNLLRGRSLSMIFQDPAASLNPVLRVGEQICQTLARHLGMEKHEARHRAVQLLTEVGIPEPDLRLSYYPHQLSGGQQQRVMIAIAIGCEPELLIADEPTSSLDVTVQRQIVSLLKEVQDRRKMALLFITHDLDLAAELSDEITVMKKGVAVESGATTSVLLSPRHELTKQLLASRPRGFRDPKRTGARLVSRADGEMATGYIGPDDGEVVMEVEQLGKDFLVRRGLMRRQTVKAVDGISFRLKRGRTLGVAGESGAGKSTVARMVLRLLIPSRGRVLFHGIDLCQVGRHEMRTLRRRLQIVFQNPYTSLHPKRTIERILVDPMEIHDIGGNDAARRTRAGELLERVGLEGVLLTRYPSELSGGQRQRIAIARSLALDPEILVCDECVSALDVSAQAQILDLLLALQRERGTSYLFISHDLAAVRMMSDDLIVMRHGDVVESGATEQVCGTPATSYTRSLLDAIPNGLAQLLAESQIPKYP